MSKVARDPSPAVPKQYEPDQVAAPSGEFISDVLEPELASGMVRDGEPDRAELEPGELAPDEGASRTEPYGRAALVGELQAELEAIRTSTWWRLGRPVRATITWLRLRVLRQDLSDGGAASIAPPQQPRPEATRGTGSLVRRLRPLVPVQVRRFVREQHAAATSNLLPVAVPDPRRVVSVDEVVSARFPLLRPLSVFPVPSGRGTRLTLVTDSLGTRSLFGGVGTSIILAALLARRLDASLRIVTRSDPPDPSRLATVLRAHEIPWDDNVEFLHSPLTANGAGVPVRSEDLFLTTSWWGTWGALRAVDPASIVYLLQEDERMFYPAGDEQLMCSEVLADERIRFVVNTSILHEYLAAEGFANIAGHGIAFEPAFPANIYYHEPRRSGGPKTFFFYARPNNVRNLFVRGLEAIRGALIDGVLKPDEWKFHFVGTDVPNVSLPHGVVPSVSENLPWPDYAALIRSVDVGLSLMSSPHPSYPPLDVAACGAVGVTNRFGPKQTLDRYSANIICSELSVDALVEAISRAVALDRDEVTRERNRGADGLSRSWSDSFQEAIDELVRTL